MNKKVGLICFVSILVLNILIVGSNEELSNKIDTKISDKIDSGEISIKVIVSLKGEVSEKSIFNLFNSKDVPEENMKSFIENYNIQDKVKNEFEYSNSFSAELTKEEIEGLGKSENVEGIYYDYPIRAFLQDSIPLINGNSAWILQSHGLNLTGKGQTVCVIDTGIDFTHPALQGKNLTCNINCIDANCPEDCSVLDLHGHGTHVAGIIGASGEINGTAKDVKMIGIRVLDSDGFGSTSNLIRGIEWCLNETNIEKYNISAISISLGCNETTTGYASFCDSTSTENCGRKSITNLVKEATNKRVQIIAATGNEYWTNAVSAPACIENVTRVGNSRDNDISLYPSSNRWNFSMLVAPGEGINSTIPGGYISWSGTSMATPHVSGAVAIIRQYLDSVNLTKTPKQIEEVLFRTGKNISADGRNYSRIDIYSALIDLDIIPPNVSLLLPTDNEINQEKNRTFICNFSDWQLKNVTLYIWNSSGKIYNSSIYYNISGVNNLTEFEFVFEEEGAYNWNCLTCDSNSNCAFSEKNHSLTVGRLPLWCALHFGHTLFSDGQMTHEEQTRNILDYYDCGATSDHDTALNQTEWEQSIETSNSNNLDRNFTYFFGTEWSGDQHIFYITLNLPNDLKKANDEDFNTPIKLSYWLSQNGGVGIYAHPARSFTSTNFSDSSKYNETWIPLVDMINNNNGIYYYHWNYYWNCSQGSGCETYTNPPVSSHLQSASGTGWVKYALDEGIHLGFSCSNDWHGAYPLEPKCYTGLANPSNWSREGVYDAILSRHTWAAEDKISMDFRTNNGTEEFIMGDRLTYQSTNRNISFEYSINSSDEKNISNVSLFYNGIIVNITNFNESGEISGEFRVEIQEEKESYFFIEAIQSDGKRAWSSPIWINYSRPIEIPAPVLTNSGGGGGSSPKKEIAENYSINEKLETPREISLKKGDMAFFKILNASHSIKVNGLNKSWISITLRSEPINLTLITGEERKINLSSETHYNLLLKFVSFEDNKANITLKEIYEPISPQTDLPSDLKEIEELVEPESEKRSNEYLKTVIPLLFLSVLLVLFWKYLKNMNRKKQGKKKAPVI